MKYAILSNLKLDTTAQKDKLTTAILARVANKPTWGEVSIGSGVDMDGKPIHSSSIRFDHKPDADDLFGFIKGQIANIPVLKGTVSQHICNHDETPWDCRNDKRAEYQEFVK